MKSTLKLRIDSLGIKLPFYLALFCAILSTANALIGYRVFKSLFERQYKTVTEQIAHTALSYINGDRISEYAVNPVEDAEWREADNRLEMLTETAYLAYIYVTVPDVNYENRVYIFDTVNSEVKNGKKYELGKVNTLKHYSEDRLNEMRRVMTAGESAIHFVYNKTGGHVTTSIPVKDSAGNNVAILSIVKPMSEVKDFKRSYRNVVLESSSIITALFVLIFILILVFRVIRPMRLITHETAHFAEHGGKISGILANVKGHDELAVLARSVEKMSEDMNQYIADLTHTTAEKERLSAELDVATQIQANMLPRIVAAFFLLAALLLAFGKTADEVRAEGTEEWIVPARCFEGNRPTTSIFGVELTPHSLGALIAVYEHIVFTEGTVWGIDSFDQWGVELGKQLAKQIVPALHDDEALAAQDASTQALIKFYRAARK